MQNYKTDMYDLIVDGILSAEDENVDVHNMFQQTVNKFIDEAYEDREHGYWVLMGLIDEIHVLLEELRPELTRQQQVEVIWKQKEHEKRIIAELEGFNE